MTDREQTHNGREDLVPMLPRVLVIDDLFGRVTADGTNPERRDLCGQFLLEDVTGDMKSGKGAPKIKRPVAQALFCRGQTPANAATGDTVENDLEATLSLVRQQWQAAGDAPPLALVLLDLCFYTGSVTDNSESKRGNGMPAGRDGDDQPETYFGLRVLEALHDRFPDLPVVILSSMSRESVSQQFSRLGALGFLPRGDANSPALLRDYISRHGLIGDESGKVIGRSKGVLLALRAARRAAVSRKNVLLRGDTGTGKELLAQYIHSQTPSIGNAPFIPVDSGALSPSLYASELFGHRRGAFTGASEDRTGRVVQANGGDLFLDEIGNMPEDVQVGLLRVIDQREVTPLGARDSQRVDVRFITATNVDIEEKAATGHGFRTDLYYRLREGGVIFLPPLRERKEDIPVLAQKFLRDAEAANPSALRRKIDPQALDVLVGHNWPGNIRELRDTVFGAVNSHPDVEHLTPVHLRLVREAHPPAQPTTRKVTTVADRRVAGIADVARLLDEFGAGDLGPSDIAGKLSVVESAYARLVARLVLAAVRATRRPTVEHPEGDVLIHPAMKLLTGDSTITASKAADLIKRLLKLNPDAVRDIVDDKVLTEALATAVRLRPTRGKDSLRRGGSRQ